MGDVIMLRLRLNNVSALVTSDSELFHVSVAATEYIWSLIVDRQVRAISISHEYADYDTERQSRDKLRQTDTRELCQAGV